VFDLGHPHWDVIPRGHAKAAWAAKAHRGWPWF